MSDLNFEALLAQHNQEYADSKVFDDWMPDDGEYIVSITKVDKGTFHKDDKDYLFWSVTGRIEDVQDEKINGKEFSLAYLTSKAFGMLKGFVKNITGEVVHDLAQASTIIESSVGQILRISVKTTPSKKHGGREFTNCYIKEVINTEVEVQTTEPVVPMAVEATIPMTAPPQFVPPYTH